MYALFVNDVVRVWKLDVPGPVRMQIHFRLLSCADYKEKSQPHLFELSTIPKLI